MPPAVPPVIVSGNFNTPFNGKIRATPDHIFVDRDTKTIVMMPFEAEFTGGSFQIPVFQSQYPSAPQKTGQTDPKVTSAESITYKWEVFSYASNFKYYLADGTEYTGDLVPTKDAKGATTGWVTTSTPAKPLLQVETAKTVTLVPGSSFHAIVPDGSLTVDYNMLIAIPSQQPYLNITIYRLVELLTSDAYRDKISSKFNLKGEYKADVPYEFGDMVRYNGNGYIWIGKGKGTGKTPPDKQDNEFWTIAVTRGEAGGTGAKIVGFDPTTWKGSDQAAARGDVLTALQAIAAAIDLSPYVKKTELTDLVSGFKNNPTFTGGVRRSSPTVYPFSNLDDMNYELVTGAYVDAAAKALITSLGVFPFPMIYAWRNSELKDLSGASGKIIAWDGKLPDSKGVANNGQITLAQKGSYLLYTSLEIYTEGLYSANNRRSIHECPVYKLIKNAQPMLLGYLFQENDSSVAGGWKTRRQGFRIINDIADNDIITINAKTSTSGDGPGLSPADCSVSPSGSAGQNNYIAIWKLT